MAHASAGHGFRLTRSTKISHSAVTERGLARCPSLLQLIYSALYGLATETCGKTHYKVDASFPGGTSQVCTGLVWNSGGGSVGRCRLGLGVT